MKIFNIIKKYVYSNKKIIIFFLLFAILFNVRLPYYLEGPGGITNVNDKVIIENAYESEGSFSFAYVSEYEGTIPVLIFGLINKDYKIVSKKEAGANDIESYSDANYRNKILLDEANDNAILYAYERAGKQILIKDSKVVVIYIDEIANTELNIGDEIISINGNNIKTHAELVAVVESLEIGEQIEVETSSGFKKTTIVDFEGAKKIGIMTSTIRDFEVSPDLKLNFDANESGPSGGLMIALNIYNNLTTKDLTNGLKIAGTGTLDINGNVGDIGGVEYKVKAAQKAGANIFFVPKGKNYDAAVATQDKEKMRMTIIGVSTFEGALACIGAL